MLLEECLGSSDLHARSLHECQGAGLLDSDSNFLVAKVDRHNASHERCQRLDTLEGSLVNFLYTLLAPVSNGSQNRRTSATALVMA